MTARGVICHQLQDPSYRSQKGPIVRDGDHYGMCWIYIYIYMDVCWMAVWDWFDG